MPRFPGGVHPREIQKARTRSLPIETLPPPERLTVPLVQHIGAPAKPIVKKGDKVARGAPIAEAGGFVSVPVHSPVSGTVAALLQCAHPLGMRADAVEIENDGEDRPAPGLSADEAVEDAAGLSPEEIRSRIQAAGICGMGGAGFPTHVKLSPPPEKPVDTLILNGAECEPALSADHRLMVERADGVARGARLLAAALGDRSGGGGVRVIFAVEENKPDAADALKRAASALDLECEVTALPVRYPQGAERQLIYALTGRKVPPATEKGLPMDVGVVVQNVGTACAVHEAVERGVPLTERILTVAGDAVERPANLMVRIGTPVETVLERAGAAPDAGVLLIGGPMMGLAQYSADVPVIKTTSGVLLSREEPSARFDPCIRCGRCVESCPMTLVPSKISVFAERGLFEDAVRWGALDCVECGCCAFVCPAERPIVHQVKLTKAESARRPA